MVGTVDFINHLKTQAILFCLFTLKGPKIFKAPLTNYTFSTSRGLVEYKQVAFFLGKYKEMHFLAPKHIKDGVVGMATLQLFKWLKYIKWYFFPFRSLALPLPKSNSQDGPMAPKGALTP